MGGMWMDSRTCRRRYEKESVIIASTPSRHQAVTTASLFHVFFNSFNSICYSGEVFPGVRKVCIFSCAVGAGARYVTNV